MEGRNSYFELQKKDEAKQRAAEERARNEMAMSYDKVFAMYDEKLGGSTKYEDRTVQNAKKLPALPRETNKAVTTSSQAYGWRQTYDDLQTGQARVAVCKKTFMNHGHL